MAKKDVVTKTINYRRFVISSNIGRELQQLLDAALVAFPKPGDRYEPLNPQSSELRVIGKHKTHNDCLCGYMSSFERGARQPVITDDSSAVSLRLSAMAPPKPKKGDAPQEFVPGVIYFVIHKNHVALVSQNSMRSNALESHLNWLLKSRTSELAATEPFSLSDEAQKATKEKIKQSHVKAIALGQPLMTAVESLPVSVPKAGAEMNAQLRKKKADPKFRPEGPMLDMIRSFFSDDAEFEKLGLDEVFDGNLEVWIEIRYPKHKRSKPEDAVKLMDALGVALRDIEGDQVSLELQNGHRISGNDLKITGSIDVSLAPDKLIDEDELFDLMVNWLGKQIKNGVIDP